MFVKRIALSVLFSVSASVAYAQSCPSYLEQQSDFAFTTAPATFTVPANVNQVRIIAIGANGGLATSTAPPTPNSPGAGARTEGTFFVTPGQVITVVAGGAGGSGDLEAGGGGASGAYLGTGVGATLLMIAGGGGGEDNTGNGGGGTDTLAASNGGSPAGGDCTAGGLGGGTLGGPPVGAGGQHGELPPPANCQTGDGGSGGGGLNSAGGTSATFGAATGHAGPSGGGQCSISGAAGGASGLRDPTDGTQPGAVGGFGLCGGGGADHRESGGGGGYSGGGGGPEGTLPGGGGSFVDSSATDTTIVAGGVGSNTATVNGSVRICYSLPNSNLQITKSNAVTSLVPGQTTTYTITAINTGPDAANNSRICDPAVTGLTCTAVTCTPAGGATCPATLSVAQLQSATGLIVPTMPVNSSVSLQLTCTLSATPF